MEGLSLNIAIPQQIKTSEGSSSNKRLETKERFKNKLKAIKKGVQPVYAPKKPVSRDSDNPETEIPKGDKAYAKPAYKKQNNESEALNHRSKKIFNPKQGYNQNAKSDNKPDFSRPRKNTKISKEKPKPPVPTKDFSEVLQIEEKKAEEGDVFAAEKFQELKKLHPFLVSVLEKNGFVTMTKIQRESIPVIMKGKDSIVKSETGSGKTLAYLVPIINILCKTEPKIDRSQGTLALVLCPTRELCIQVLNTATTLLNAFVHIIPGALMVK